ncbi:mechanosensitive ion channel family protein [Candidatus Poribacteria bacterium]|nr:mechanosensitive ion channel family protein [Candidatus Poribacteria bacterium]
MEAINSFFGTIMTIFNVILASKYRGVFLSAIIVILLVIIRRVLTRVVESYIRRHAFKDKNATQFMMTWKYVWTVIIAIFGIVGLSGSLKVVGISAGFMGMVLGWSLQAPVTGLAAWLLIILKRPFKIGDRVVIADIIGDVMDITLTHIVLNQVGGTVGGEERSGRAVLIPNAIMFGLAMMNYTLQQDYILDEVPVRVTFESDLKEAENILINAAKEVTKEIIEKTGEEPFIRAELFESGTLMRLRYKVDPPRRQEVSTYIVKIIFNQFGKNPKVEFCYPKSDITYQWKGRIFPPHPAIMSQGSAGDKE